MDRMSTLPVCTLPLVSFQTSSSWKSHRPQVCTETPLDCPRGATPYHHGPFGALICGLPLQGQLSSDDARWHGEDRMTDSDHGVGNPPLRAGILLDRDGTIIVDHGYVGSVDRVEFIDGAAAAIAGFNRAGHPRRGGHQPVRHRPGPVRLRRRRPGAQVHRGASGRARGPRRPVPVFPLPSRRRGRGVRPRERRPQARPGHGEGGSGGARPRPRRLVGRRRPARGRRSREGDRCLRGLSGYRPLASAPGSSPFPSLAAAAPFILERITT